MAQKNLKIDCISDTHGQHQNIHLLGGDILIHSGDCSSEGQLEEVLEFLDWFQRQDYSHRILIAGNHDFIFELIPEQMEIECKKRGILYLNDSGCVVEGIKVWGSPVQPWFYDWAFNRNRGPEIKKHWDLIPKETEILITHGPPYKIQDRVANGHVGCIDLYQKLVQTQVKLHVFGHIHEGAGYTSLNGRTFVNASSVDGSYLLNEPAFLRVLKQEGGYVVVDE